MTEEQIIEAAIQGHASTRDAIMWAMNQVCKDAEPVAFEFQHEDTGLFNFVDPQQVEWGFQKNNPRWQLIGPVFRHPAPAVVRQPLTDEQIDALLLPESGTGTIRDLVRIIEAAHGIGGNDD